MSTELAIPTTDALICALDTPTLYALEQAGSVARTELDTRIVTWTTQGWTVRQIAQEIGCSKSVVNRRQQRLGVQASDPRGGDHFVPPGDKEAEPSGCNGEIVDTEVVDAEVVPEELDFVCEQEWSEEERDLRAELEDGQTILVNFGRHRDLVRWAEAEGLLVRIDRKTDWGNPFKLDADGDRDTVIASYRAHYLPHKPSLQGRLGELRGKALGCWCAPEACHGDVLLEALQ